MHVVGIKNYNMSVSTKPDSYDSYTITRSLDKGNL